MKMKRSPKAKSTVFDITETEDKVRQPPKLDRMTQLLKELRNIRKSIHKNPGKYSVKNTDKIQLHRPPRKFHCSEIMLEICHISVFKVLKHHTLLSGL